MGTPWFEPHEKVVVFPQIGRKVETTFFLREGKLFSFSQSGWVLLTPMQL